MNFCKKIVLSEDNEEINTLTFEFLDSLGDLISSEFEYDTFFNDVGAPYLISLHPNNEIVSLLEEVQILISEKISELKDMFKNIYIINEKVKNWESLKDEKIIRIEEIFKKIDSIINKELRSL